jgi:hypothetical protein
MADKKIKGKFGTIRVVGPVPRKFKGAFDVGMPFAKELKTTRIGNSSDGLQFSFSDKTHAIKFSKYMLQQGHKTKIGLQFAGNNTVTIKENTQQEGDNTMKIKMSELKEMIVEILKEEESAYQKFFKEKLAGRNLGDMSDEEKKAFFADVDKGWKGKGEANETLKPVSPAEGNPLKRVKAKKRDQILAAENKVEEYVRKLVREELKFVMFNEVPGTSSRKVAKKRISQTGNTTSSL